MSRKALLRSLRYKHDKLSAGSASDLPRNKDLSKLKNEQPSPARQCIKAAGGEIQLEIFEGAAHERVAQPGALADRAHEMVKIFITRQMRI